jgi:hypothetical protein
MIKGIKDESICNMIIDFESGDMSMEDVITLFQHLVDTGVAWELQGSYGRLASQLIEQGLVDTRNNVRI